MECVLLPCKNKGGSTVTLTSKGLRKIVECSALFNDGLDQKLKGKTNVTVHVECRKSYTRRPDPTNQPTSAQQHVQRSVFDFKTQCFFCERRGNDPSKFRKPNQENWSAVETLELVDSVRSFTAKRGDCVWAQEVERRLAGVIDLVAAEGRYHRYCYCRYQVPGSSKPGSKVKQGGARVQKYRIAAFDELCSYIEGNEECQFTVSELVLKLTSIEPLAAPYSEAHLKRKLIERYGENITVTEIPGKQGVICFSGLADKILNDRWYEDRKRNLHDEKKRIIETAVMIILQDIRSCAYDCSVYPSTEDIISCHSDSIPITLSLLIDSILMPKPKQKLDKKLKRKSIVIQHSVMSAVRPRSFLSPLHIGLSVHLHRRYGSKMLVDLLSNLGICSSYKETMKYEASVTLNARATVNPEGYMQFVFDNADHNVNTLDGNNTFHAMGGIQCITPKTAVQVKDHIPRPSVTSTAALIGSVGLRAITFYQRPVRSGYSTITVEDVTQLTLEPKSAVLSRHLDALWAMGAYLDVSHIGWNGFMERVYGTKQSYDVSAVLPLPFVNLDPSNLSTIYTCLLYAAEECKAHGQSHVMVTFDQPLFAKATEMVLAAASDSPLSRVVVRLGGFHLLMSFMGSVGQIMAGSGLEELWETIYAKNSVVHMMSGRAYGRALRAHLLSQQALTTLLFHSAALNEKLAEEYQSLYQALFENTTSVDDMQTSEGLQKLSDMLTERLSQSAANGRTGKLWVQYMKMVDIIRFFIRAERSGDWNLHIYSVELMIPYLHASGHLNYARSAHVYLQMMLKLQETLLTEEFEKFSSNGFFTIRRSNKFWSGIWSDMTIEQVLMRSMKTSGGLTNGRGLASSTIARWVHTTPATTRITETIEEFSGIEGATCEQHVDLRESRQGRDKGNIKTLVDWLRLHHPFERASPLLTSISNGVVANESVNCDDAEQVGMVSLKKTVGKTFSSVTLHRKDNVKPLAHVTKTIKVYGNDVVVNPNQLFHRIVCVVRSDEELALYLQYELAARPPALFDDLSIRKGNKASLVPILETFGPCKSNIPEGATYTVDGGCLLHQVVWLRQATYSQICEQYVRFVVQRYGQCHVVFDGYSGSSTKDTERIRRSKSTASVDVLVEDNLYISTSQQDFLANSANKSRLIALLKLHLEASSCHVNQAMSDADTLIVSTAIRNAVSGVSVLVGQDTDLLVLLVALATNDVLMLFPGTGKTVDRVFSSKTLQEGLGDMTRFVLFLHAFTGCDTTSAIFNKGKKVPFKMLKESEELRQQVDVFNIPDSSPERVAAAGVIFFMTLYKVKGENDLNSARHRMYLRTIAKQRLSASFSLASLPPTEAAARQHSFRVYHQVQQWRGVELAPTSWGWKLENQELVPVPSLQVPAPQNLLRLICCNCKINCEKNCECRRSSLACSLMCGQCSGIGCSNASSVCEDVDDDLEQIIVSGIDEVDDLIVTNDMAPPPTKRRCQT